MIVRKYIGRDCELSTTGLDPEGHTVQPGDVTRAVLDGIGAAFEPHGLSPWHRQGSWYSSWSSDCRRFWMPNGQCYYSDMSHVEVCTAATEDPLLYAAQCISTLSVAEQARERAEARAAPGTRYSLSTANVDPLDPAVSWGTHLNIAVGMPLWEQLFVDHSHPATLGFVASALAAAVPFFGVGYLYPRCDGRVAYSLSARAHHLTRMSTLPTTAPYERGLLNSRREAHGEGQERLHLICFDFALVGAALQACFLQCCLAAAEEGFCGLSLFAPLAAMQGWSWDLDLSRWRFPATATLVDGRSLTLPAYVRDLTASLLQMCEAGLITEDVAPRAQELLPRIVELTRYMEEGSLSRCGRHLDWAAKLLCLLDLSRGDGAALGDAESRLLDHDFANTDPQRGVFWRLWERGLVDPLVQPHEVAACLLDGPERSRGWGRGRLIQKFREEITGVDWSYVELRRPGARSWSRMRVGMPALDTLNRIAFEPLIEAARDVGHLEELLAGGAPAIDPGPGYAVQPYPHGGGSPGGRTYNSPDGH